ncbi:MULTISPECIES: response regulator [Methanothermobacter]|uniref:Sensory transduction regulatory protein n=1 Tax=Methanothermobacter thermautotrophicus (strain ATCC 29096 / DSM 1053 / JCM 10044 / NBRC 100330 / Delta H) TaxID=187420 RepID=O26649_METTH|nr:MULTISPECIES: response regulator [Methanothermobacter]AAB85055.1 sensory transduction regulatory protein [Methanothermobacter thermautotrophicus str. Delta H]MDK2875191.1 hypothetical protein [Methanothermobacter sp.]MDN5374027.1 hypothetical protein [Methanothermobacter sp.]BAZ98596.1 putative transcriptional regulatory protein pdtaR [Methanothermobacter sp. EMTCatA1]
MTSILIVEDEALIAADLRTRLERMGYEVVGAAGDGREALKLIAEKRPDLVLMDDGTGCFSHSIL